MARTFGTWLSGPPPPEAGDSSQGPNDYPGQRLGLPPSGAGSLVGWGRRISALLVDWFIAVGISGLAVPLGLWSSDEWFYSTDSRQVMALIWLVLGIVSVRLFSFTPGQAALGLQVASVDHRIHVGVGRALARGVLVALVIPPLFTDSDGRGLQDKATGTAIVRR